MPLLVSPRARSMPETRSAGRKPREAPTARRFPPALRFSGCPRLPPPGPGKKQWLCAAQPLVPHGPVYDAAEECLRAAMRPA